MNEGEQVLTRNGWSRHVRGHLLFCLSLLFAGALASQPAAGAELVMFETPGCMWCRQWHAEIGPGYPKTTEGRQAPLRRNLLTEPPVAGLKLAAAVTLTPTFVLAEGGREVGRIAGYPGSEFFYSLLGDLLKRLPDAQTPPHEPANRVKSMNP